MMETIVDRQRLQKKELEHRITELRKTIPPNDKKKKKEVNAEINRLREELNKRHEAESAAECPADPVSDQLNRTTLSNDAPPTGFRYEIREVSKAQKKKDKKLQAKREREAEIQNEDVSALTESKVKEEEKLNSILKSRGLKIFEIPSDGDCLYNSIKDQLSRVGQEHSVSDLRQRAADYMRQHCDDFRPFLPSDDSGLISDENFNTYCDRVEKSKDWGGQLELRALSESLKRPVEVIQADGPCTILGSEFGYQKPLLVSYHRHAFSLGEHYNSVIPKG